MRIEAWDEEGGGVLIPAFVEPLTQEDYDRLVSGRSVVVRHKAASLIAEACPVMCNGERVAVETMLVMRGPSGEHRLMVIATPLARLNAHWIVFASHPLNQTAPA